MRKIIAIVIAIVMLVTTAMAANYNGYAAYGPNGLRNSYSTNLEYYSSWFAPYANRYGIEFHVPPQAFILRSDVFAVVGKAMDAAYERAGRDFSYVGSNNYTGSYYGSSYTNYYGGNYGYSRFFSDYTWDASLEEVARGLMERRIMGGYPDGTVRFANTINRAEFAKIVTIVANENGIRLPSADNMSLFADVPKTHWARGYIEQCTALGLFTGFERNGCLIFDPTGKVTIEQFLAVMLRIAELQGNRTLYTMVPDDVAAGTTNTMDIDFRGFVENLEVATDEVHLEVGDSESVSANMDVTWYSRNTNVATVNNTGRIRGVGPGTTFVEARTQRGLVATVLVVVTDTSYEDEALDNVAPVLKVEVDDKVETEKISDTDVVYKITSGETISLTVIVEDDNLESFEITEDDIRGMNEVEVVGTEKISENEYIVYLVGGEQVAAGELHIAEGVATDASGNTSEKTAPIPIWVVAAE